MKKETPILFSTPMVQAILAGIKTTTRRIIKPKPIIDDGSGFVFDGKYKKQYDIHDWKDKFIDDFSNRMPGDILWVRESWRCAGGYKSKPSYKVMDPGDFVYKADEDWNGPFKPSIHMPKEAARIRLEVTNIRVERLQPISEEDAKAEGVTLIQPIPKHHYHSPKSYKEEFMNLWCRINGNESWNENPWVWVVEFKVLSTTGKLQLK